MSSSEQRRIKWPKHAAGRRANRLRLTIWRALQSQIKACEICVSEQFARDQVGTMAEIGMFMLGESDGYTER